MPGRPKPTGLKVIEGNPGKRPLPKEPKPRPKAPKMPKDINKNAQKIYKQLAPTLERLGLLTEIDGHVLAHLCQLRAFIIQLHKAIDDHNKSLLQEIERPQPDGSIKKELKAGPYITLLKQLYEIFRKHAAEFGLSPRGRAGLQVGVDKDQEGEDLLS